MTQDELLAMLELDATPVQVRVVAPSPVPGIPGTESVPGMVSDSALELDEWDRLRGAEIATKPEAHKMGLDATAWADFHAMAYNPDIFLSESCSDPTRLEFCRNLLDSSEFQSLRVNTVLDSVCSELAAHQFAASFTKLVERKKEIERSKRPEKSKKRESDSAMFSAIASAIAEAEKETAEIKETAELIPAMGAGMEGGKPDPKRIADIHKKIRNSPTLRRIMEFAGKFRMVASAKQRTKPSHGQDEIIGIIQDGEIGRLLPVELSRLTDSDLEIDTLRRIVERQAQCRETVSRVQVGKGPVIVVVDESGSMRGEPVERAKGFAIAMVWLARSQRRWACLVAYSGGSRPRVLVLPPGKPQDMALLEWLSDFIGKGSYLDLPIRELPRIYADSGAPEGKTDVIMITDAYARIPDDLASSYNDWQKDHKVTTTTLVVSSDPGDVAKIGTVKLVPKIDTESTGVVDCLEI